MTGTVQSIKEERGYGFVRESDTGKDYFFHCRENRQIPFDTGLIGRMVAFDLDHDNRGPRAVAMQIF